MPRRVMLHALAHARAGDKGDHSDVSVWMYKMRHFSAVRAQLTPEQLERTFGRLLRGPIWRYELPHLGSLNFVMGQTLEGGVNESLNLDAHGKSGSFLVLGLEIKLNDTTAKAPPRAPAE